MSALTIWFCKYDAKFVYVETFSWFTARAVARQDLRADGARVELTEISEADPRYRFVRATMGAGIDGRPNLIVSVVRRAHRSVRKHPVMGTVMMTPSPVEELVTR